jgi:hypothetical protein
MSTVAREAMLRDVQRIRQSSRGDVRRYRLTFRCAVPDCGVQSIIIYVLEEPGIRPFQPPNYCNRCRSELTVYVGSQVGW